LTGLIIGDGNLSNYTKSKTDLSLDYRIYIDMSDLDFMHYIERLFKSIIVTKSKLAPTKLHGNRKPRLRLQIRNKGLFYFFVEKMGIPRGNKSSIVCVPKKIMSASIAVKNAFLTGYFDADGGFRGGTLGFTSASHKLLQGVSSLLTENEIQHSEERWINKKYRKEFYGLRISKKQIDTFLNRFSFQNKNKLDKISSRFFCGGAGVAKRDR